ncbi:MAG: pyridoxal phosphate-dependent aminotransferase family protein [Maribacter sp.]|nr:pyridoxal phosphate-dependent aminotransferase family protein [Maribacter sp.]
MEQFPEKLLVKLSERKDNNALRSLPDSNPLVDFASNDYLGLAKNEDVFQHSLKMLKEYDFIRNGASGSRLLSGNHILYTELEKKLCDFYEVEAALVFNSGYDANIGFFSSVPQRSDIVFYDEFIHASIRDGIRLGNAKSYKFKHNNLGDLIKKCEDGHTTPSGQGPNQHAGEVYIVTESVFSMDGDSPDLKKLITFCNANNYHLVVDEAHAIGVYGKKGAGLLQATELQEQVFARIVTFGKALGCHGAAILGSEKLKSYLVNYARSFIYTTGLSPHSVATIIAAHHYLGSTQGTEVRKKLNENIEFLNQKLKNPNLKLKFIASNSAIHCCKIKGNDKVKRVSKSLQEKGFDVKPILSPTVPKGEERLRFCLHAFNSERQLKEVMNLLQSII